MRMTALPSPLICYPRCAFQKKSILYALLVFSQEYCPLAMPKGQAIHVRFALRPEDSIHEVSHLMLEQDELLAPGRGFGCRMICLGLCLWKLLAFFEVP